jgi:indolepyruvate ferredoxin oxidoreductase alpha subunit
LENEADELSISIERNLGTINQMQERINEIRYVYSEMVVSAYKNKRKNNLVMYILAAENSYQAYKRISREMKIEPVGPSDIGCYCLGANPPLNAFDSSTCMGGGFDIANGISHAIKAPVVAQLGDSTFFHSGIAPMINAVFNKSKVTMLIMDNGTTAMTGSQPDPGNPGNGETGIKPEELAKACNVKFVEVVNAFDVNNTADILEKAMRFEGPAVVVSRGLCAILAQRERRQRGKNPQLPRNPGNNTM